MKPLPYVWIAAGILFLGATVWINYEVKVDLQAASQGGATRELGEIRVGQQAPYFSTQDPAGQTVSLADFRGHKVVVLDFWASWCPPCKMAMPGLQRVQDDFRGRDLEILSINQDESAATATDFMRKKGYSLHVLLDPDPRSETDTPPVRSRPWSSWTSGAWSNGSAWVTVPTTATCAGYWSGL